MSSLDQYGIDEATLKRMYDEYCSGSSKSELERRYLSKPTGHGKVFTKLVRDHLGIETEARSRLSEELDRMTSEISRLRALLASHGIEPDEALGS